ncbi:hypothetical protein F5X96DRAFT_300371 [Biscogniauxia mediterranea]|nr:hypothetical protein F5X96DRAFT_300371 [Biscogniauxia mediterranea]
MEGRHRARCLAHKYNNVDPNSGTMDEVSETQTKILTEMLGRVGKGTVIERPFLPDYGSNIIIGENCFMNFK